MPSHRIHKFFSKKFLGKPYSEVHRAIDQPYLFLGRRHRCVFHTPTEAYCMGVIASGGDSRGGDAGVMHVWLDKHCSEHKDFKKWLEFSAKQEEIYKRQMRLLKELANPKHCRKAKRKRRTPRRKQFF